MKAKNKAKNETKEAGNYLSLPKPQPRLGAASGSNQPLVWNTRYVLDLIARAGEKAEVLCLGRLEAETLKEFLKASYPGEDILLQDYRYAGLRVVTVGEESCIRVETPATIYENSRHALLRKHEERPRGEVRKSLEVSEFRFRMER